MRATRLLAGCVIVALAGCNGMQSGPSSGPGTPTTPATPAAPRPSTVKIEGGFKGLEKEVRSQSPAAGLAYLRSHCKTGRLGDVLIERLPTVTIEGVGVVYGLNGRGTKNVAPGQDIRKRLNKSLDKEFREPGAAAKELVSGDAAAVSVVALLPPFASNGDKIEVKMQAFDRTVNLEGGFLGEVELEEFMEMPAGVNVDPMFTYSGRRASRGVQAYARGLVSLVPGIKDGKIVGMISPETGYLPAGALVKDNHGVVLRLKQANGYEALLAEYLLAERFHIPAKASDEDGVRVPLPPEYASDKPRFVNVLNEIDTGLTAQETPSRVDALLGQLGSGDARSRDRAEYALEAIGSGAVQGMMNSLKSSQGAKRAATLRVLAQMGVTEIGADVLTEARSSNEAERLDAARLLGRIRPPKAEAALVQLLSDDSPAVRFAAVQSLEDINNPKNPLPVEWYFSKEKNFVMNRVDVPGRPEVVVYSGPGVRRIEVFGKSVNVNDGFKGGGGLAEVKVDGGRTNIVFKHRPDLRPVDMPSADIRDIVHRLDVAGVTINDILALIAEIDRTRSLNARIVWLN